MGLSFGQNHLQEAQGEVSHIQSYDLNGYVMDNWKFLEKRVHEIEKDLTIPKGFFWSLLKEDDWSFIIKLHSLIEAAVTQLLLKEIARPELENVFANIELSNSRAGKMVFLKDLGLLKPYHRYVRVLSEIRNDFVHNISNVKVSLKEYLDNKPDQKNNLFKSIQNVYNKELKLKDLSGVEKRVSETFKYDLLFISLFMLSNIYLHTRPKKL